MSAENLPLEPLYAASKQKRLPCFVCNYDLTISHFLSTDHRLQRTKVLGNVQHLIRVIVRLRVKNLQSRPSYKDVRKKNSPNSFPLHEVFNALSGFPEPRCLLLPSMYEASMYPSNPHKFRLSQNSTHAVFG